jgi:uncharacterized membrane protein (DUF2068 family)
MSNSRTPITYRGRNFGIIVLVAVQSLVGFIHVLFGFLLLSAPRIEPFALFASGYLSSDVYAVYTMLFGLLTLIFTYALWMEKRWGWIGTVAVAAFVIIADALTLLDLPSIPGIPKFAGYGEITYSVLILLYLFQNHVRTKYRISLE